MNPRCLDAVVDNGGEKPLADGSIKRNNLMQREIPVAELCPSRESMNLENTENGRRSSASKPIPWDHIPHEALSLEISARLSRRAANEADCDVALEHLRERLGLLDVDEHDEYIRLVASDLRREMRICRDVYAEYLGKLNNKSVTAKARVALDFGVAPRASARLRKETIVYVRRVGVSDAMFAKLFHPLGGDRLMTHSNFASEFLTLESTVCGLIEDPCFQELKEVTSRELCKLAASPFSFSVQPFERVLIPLDGSEVRRIPNPIWDDRNLLLGYELWRLWDFVFREICDQHAAIDYEEQSNVAQALMSLNPFERLAGRLLHEACEAYPTRIPDSQFEMMASQLDRARIPLFDYLGAKGKEILNHLARKGKPVKNWGEAISDNRDHRFLPNDAPTREAATTLKEFGTLKRAAKRAFYLAKDTYDKALTRVYETRLGESAKLNPFKLGR